MKTKYESLNIYLFEVETLAKHFEEMAQQGWMLTRIGTMRITYQECEPLHVHFYIDIYTKGSYMNPQIISSEEKEYGDFISEYGYEFVTRTANFQVFRSYQHDIIPIHYEDPEITNAQRKTIWKYEFYNHISVALLLIPLNLLIFRNSYSLYTFKSNLSIFLHLLIPLAIFLFVLRVYPTLKWLTLKDRYSITTIKMAQRNRFTNRYLSFLIIFWILALICFGFINLIPILLMFLIIGLSFFLVDPLLARFIKKHHSMVSIILCLYIGMYININFIIFQTTDEVINNDVATLTYQKFRSDLPEVVQHNVQYEESFIMKEEQYSEYYFDTQDQIRNTQEDIYFGYELYTIHAPFLQDYLQNLAIKQRYRPFYLVEENLNENISYKLYRNEYNTCLIWDRYILILDIDNESLTHDQIASILRSVV